MTYRDDREALQSRVRELEEDLGKARREGEEQGREAGKERAEELEKKLASVRGELDRMGAELREMRGDKPAAKASGRMGLVLGLMAAVAAGAFFLVRERATVPPPAPVVQQPVGAPSPPPSPAAPEPPEEPKEPAKPAEPLVVPRTARARWKATVKRAEGVALAPGSSCVVEAVMRTMKTNTTVPALTVTCGNQVLYDNRATLNGASHMDNDARERLGPDDETSRFSLQYSDVGARTGARAQIDLDTTKKAGAVFRETLPRSRVELTLPVESEPTAPLAGVAQRLRRSAHVTEVSGSAPVKVGAACVLRAMPTGKGEDCVAELRCGGAVLFPVSAEGVQCSYSGAQVTLAAKGGEPLELGMSDTGVQVKATGAKAFTAVLGFDR